MYSVKYLSDGRWSMLSTRFATLTEATLAAEWLLRRGLVQSAHAC